MVVMEVLFACQPLTGLTLNILGPVVKNVPGASPGVWPMTNLWQVVEPGPLQA
jgi:hypothetical protein